MASGQVTSPVGCVPDCSSAAIGAGTFRRQFGKGGCGGTHWPRPTFIGNSNLSQFRAPQDVIVLLMNRPLPPRPNGGRMVAPADKEPRVKQLARRSASARAAAAKNPLTAAKGVRIPSGTQLYARTRCSGVRCSFLRCRSLSASQVSNGGCHHSADRFVRFDVRCSR
jgi:hypothetical protein